MNKQIFSWKYLNYELAFVLSEGISDNKLCLAFVIL